MTTQIKRQASKNKMAKRKMNRAKSGSQISFNFMMGVGLLGLLGFLLSSNPAFAGGNGFPRVEATSDREEILSQYPAYLHFVVAVGKDVDRSNTVKLTKLYSTLLRRSPNSAALFLKGLRFEMVQKVELMGRGSNEISTRTPEIRRWIARYMKEWTREADEHLFRAISAPSSELARME